MKLERTDYLESGIFGILHVTDSLKFATIEHAYPLTVADQQVEPNYFPKVPCGTYKCVRGLHRLESMADGFYTFEVTNVPGHTNILIHPGNSNKDSEGCILIGEYRKDNMIFQSRKAFDEFMNALVGVNEFELEIV